MANPTRAVVLLPMCAAQHVARAGYEAELIYVLCRSPLLSLADGSVTEFSSYSGSHDCHGDAMALSDTDTVLYVGYSAAESATRRCAQPQGDGHHSRGLAGRAAVCLRGG